MIFSTGIRRQCTTWGIDWLASSREFSLMGKSSTVTGGIPRKAGDIRGFQAEQCM